MRKSLKMSVGKFKPLLYTDCSRYAALHMSTFAKNKIFQAGLNKDVECEFEGLNYRL